jgi:transcriptional regulator with XRE-family HTH domain
MQEVQIQEEAPVIAAATAEAPDRVHGGAREGAGRKRSGLALFGEWADANGWTSKRLAKRLGISHSMAAQLITGRRRPSLELMKEIKALTDGKIDYEDWLKV